MEKLTKRTIEAAPLPLVKKPADLKRWTWLGDAEVRGFGVKLYGSGARVFALRYRTQGGRSRMLTLGPFGELTVQQARDMARREKVRVLDGADPQAERQKKAVALATVRDLMGRWLDDHAKAHRRRWVEDQRRTKTRILPGIGRLRIEDLTPEVLAGWHRKLGKEAPVEANRCVETVRSAWRWAEREGLLPEGLSDPSKRVKRYRERSRDRWLRKEEVARLMKAVQAEDDPYIRAAIPLFLLTGLRKRELLSARWADVDLARGEIRLRQTKTGVPQVRLLPGPAVEILRSLPRMRESPYLFPGPANPKSPRDDIKKPWNRIRKAAGLDKVTLHDLRRTAGSHMAQAGVPLQVIGEVLGHTHPGVTKLYARLASENEREALDTLAQVLRGPLGLPGSGSGTEELSDRLRTLLRADGDDPEALAAGLRRLVDWERASEA
ncbi:MAG: hypothetical protein AMXMBFR53_42810 [Gemmatimonadota bacterium]